MKGLFGLVLAGGEGSRMGGDKGLLQYRDKPHRFWLCDLLGAYCERAFISVNGRQEQIGAERYAYIADAGEFADNGPIGALLSADRLYPGMAWFVVSCDLPFFEHAAARALLLRRDPATVATAFVNPETGQPEPLVTVYEPPFMADLPGAFAQGERSMRRMLSRARVALVTDFDRRWIHSANTPEEFRRAAATLRAADSASSPTP